MNEFDRGLKARAAEEASPVPADFDGRIGKILESLPEKPHAVRRGRALRPALLAATLCVLLAVSALALSPGLREQLAAVLGGFEPYMQELDGTVCVQEGIEVRVISAVADSYMTRIYAEVRDLEGNRVTEDLTAVAAIARIASEENRGWVAGAKCVGFDKETGTALLELKEWVGDESFDGVEKMKLQVYSFFPNSPEEIRAEQGWEIDFSVENLAQRRFLLNGTVDGTELMQAKMSTLGIMLETKGKTGSAVIPAVEYQCGIYLKDGTVVQAHTYAGTAGGDSSNETYLEFDDPVDLDQVTGILVNGWMIPIDGDTAGEGYWLSELPQ